MAEQLQQFINRVVQVADKRNLARENPVTIMVDVPGQDRYYVVVSHIEPNHVTLPLNVTWIVADSESPMYLKALRRASALPFDNYRNTWAELRTYEDFIEEPQFWDLSATFQLGEVQITGVREATDTARGTFKLNREPDDPAQPIVISGNDPRMSDARAPLPHDHPYMPSTMLAGSQGINDFYVTISDSMSPEEGEVLFITEPGDEPGEWMGIWRKLESADIGYDGPTFDALVINGTADGTVEEGTPVPFTANAEFSDGNTIQSVDALWEIIAGSEGGTISSSTGVFTPNDVPEDTLVRIRATWTHPVSQVQRSATYDLTVVDTTIVAMLVDIVISGVTTLREGGNTTAMTVTAEYDDGTTRGVSPTTFTSSNPAAGTLSSETGIFTSAVEVTNNQTTMLTATYTENGVTKSASLELVVEDMTVYPQSAEIVGPSTVNENTETTYTLVVTFSDLTTSQVAVSDWAIDNPAAGSIDASSGVLSSPTDLQGDELAQLSASYTSNGRTATATKDITVSDESVYPAAARILGPGQVDEGTVVAFQLEVDFTDGTTSTVNVSDWATSVEAAGAINATTGEFAATLDLLENTDTVISASFTQSGTTVDATRPITVRDVTNYPTSVAIVGSSSMDEGSTQTLILRVSYADGQTADKPAVWSSDDTNVATVSASGLVTAAVSVDANATANITAAYVEHGVELSDTLVLTVRDITIYPVSAIVIGPTTVSENTTVNYQLEVTYDDGSKSIEPVNTWALSDPAAGTLTTTGALTAPANVVTNIPAEVSATFAVGATIVTGTLAITVVDETVYPASARIIGPVSVDEETTQAYQFEVTFTDASVSIVSPTDWASSNTAAATINANTGMLTALSQASDTTTQISASYTSSGTQVNAVLDVTVADSTNYPVSATILGATSIAEGNTETFTLEVTFKDGTVQVMPVSDWANSNAAAGVINVTSGVFQAKANVTSDVVTSISASYTAFGTQVTDTLAVTVTDETAYPVSAVVIGPNTVPENTSATYLLRVTFTDSSVVDVPADDWTVDNPAAGTIDAATGEFSAADNSTQSNITATIEASWTVETVSVTGSTTIGVTDETVYPQSAQIVGQSNIDEGGTAQYTLEVTYTDASTATVTASDWAVDNSVAGSIDSSTGLFTASDEIVGPKTASVTASYTENGVPVGAALPITVSDTKIRPTALTINGPATLAENSTQQYTLTATFDDGTTATVTASDWDISPLTAGTIGAATGLLEAADVSGDTVATLTCSYVAHGTTVNATLDVTITDTGVAGAGQPRWGYAPYAGAGLNENGYNGPQDFLDREMDTLMATAESGETLTYFLPDGNTYAYFAFPTALGTATFTDMANNFAGAWDGATWLPDMSNIDDTGPIIVTYDDGSGPADWYVYRTDWAGPNYQNTTFRVDYSG